MYGMLASQGAIASVVDLRLKVLCSVEELLFGQRPTHCAKEIDEAMDAKPAH